MTTHTLLSIRILVLLGEDSADLQVTPAYSLFQESQGDCWYMYLNVLVHRGILQTLKSLHVFPTLVCYVILSGICDIQVGLFVFFTL